MLEVVLGVPALQSAEVRRCVTSNGMGPLCESQLINKDKARGTYQKCTSKGI